MTKRPWHAGVVIVGLLLWGAVVPATAANAAPARTETAVAGSSPVTAVIESEVARRIPLPPAAGAHPADCDWVRFLRFRHRNGPARSANAHKILVAQPGILEGAGAFDSVARNTIVRAAERGRFIEFWALDRRSNCLEDRTGIRAGLAARNVQVALDYYYGNAAVNGRRFAGFLDNGQVGWLANLGIEQTVRDQFDLLAAELPDPALRKRKVLCGGHSLGGIITGFFAAWDFDGDRSTTADAGFNQCAGYFALDTTITTSLADLSGQMPTVALPDIGLGYAVIKAGLESGLLSRIVAAPAVINPETMNLLGIAGLAAATDPDRETLLPALPSNLNIGATERLLFSKDLANLISGEPSIRDFHLTNAAMLGGLMDDNSQPLAFMQTSVGFLDGGRVTDKDLLLPGLGGLGARPLAAPDEPNGPLYTWRNYHRIGAPDDPVHRTAGGQPFSTPGEEVTDVGELARSLAEHPLDFTEQYFPTRLVTDVQQTSAPQISRFLVHPQGLTANPVITLLAGNGLRVRNGRPIPPELNAVIAPGYEHLDVLTAAPTQNNGQPEIVSTNLARFAVS